MQWKMDFIRQLEMTSSVTGQRRILKAHLKARIVPKKGQGTVWWFAAYLIPYSFLNPSETITFEMLAQQIKEMH